MSESKEDRLDALVEKSWMYRALKSEHEIAELRKDVDALRRYHQRSMEGIFDRLHDIAVAVRAGGHDPREDVPRSDYYRTQEAMKKLATNMTSMASLSVKANDFRKNTGIS